MREPSEVAGAKLSLAIADLQDALAAKWDETIGRWLGVESKLPRWAEKRRKQAHHILARWPESAGGTLPDEAYEEWLRQYGLDPRL